jgi:hypothetical protein
VKINFNTNLGCIVICHEDVNLVVLAKERITSVVNSKCIGSVVFDSVALTHYAKNINFRKRIEKIAGQHLFLVISR